MRIGESAFSGCKQLQNIDLPSSIIEIGAGAFAGCRNLLYVKLPNKLKCIDIQLFDHCRKLTHIQIPDSVEVINNMAFELTNLNSVHLPKNLKKIGVMAFAGTSLSYIESKSSNFKVENMTIYSGNGKELIQYYGHDERVVIPNTVVKIADYAFACAYSIRELIIPDSVEEIGKEFLEEVLPDKIIVPAKLKDMVTGLTESYYHEHIIVSE